MRCYTARQHDAVGIAGGSIISAPGITPDVRLGPGLGKIGLHTGHCGNLLAPSPDRGLAAPRAAYWQSLRYHYGHALREIRKS